MNVSRANVQDGFKIIGSFFLSCIELIFGISLLTTHLNLNELKSECHVLEITYYGSYINILLGIIGCCLTPYMVTNDKVFIIFQILQCLNFPLGIVSIIITHNQFCADYWILNANSLWSSLQFFIFMTIFLFVLMSVDMIQCTKSGKSMFRNRYDFQNRAVFV